MTSQVRIAGGVVALSGAVVLLGWMFEITSAISLLPGWRVMVPSSAFSFVCVRLALMLGSRPPSLARTIGVPLLAMAGVTLPFLTLIEYAAGIRFGLENWLGFSFTGEGSVAGRMSPLSSLCFAVLCPAISLLPFRGPNISRFVRLASGATLMTIWLAVLALSFDTQRLQDAPRFPGMAALTIVLMATASASALALSLQHSRLRQVDVGPATRQRSCWPGSWCLWLSGGCRRLSKAAVGSIRKCSTRSWPSALPSSWPPSCGGTPRGSRRCNESANAPWPTSNDG